MADHRFQQALGYVAMSDDYKIYVDAAQPATLNEGAGKLGRSRTPLRPCLRPRTSKSAA
jgi:hypothetical protein